MEATCFLKWVNYSLFVVAIIVVIMHDVSGVKLYTIFNHKCMLRVRKIISIFKSIVASPLRNISSLEADAASCVS